MPDQPPVTSRPLVHAVHRSDRHGFSKHTCPAVQLIEGLGVEGDAHAGVTVQHRSRVAKNPAAANLRQVHLIEAERLAELANEGFDVSPGVLGENVTTKGLDLLALTQGTRLTFNSGAQIELTGLRNPCGQLDNFAPGLMSRLRTPDGRGGVIRLAGVMGVVTASGSVAPGNVINVWQPEAGQPLQVV